MTASRTADQPMVGTSLRTPRAAAVAGIAFSILLTISLWLLRISIPERPLGTGEWLTARSGRVLLALDLVPFAGIAFMWFLGVLRDRLGAREDRFFATVFLGSGLLFLGMLFVAAATIGALVLAYATAPQALLSGAPFAFARAFAFGIMHVYAFKMAAVFMVASSTLIIRTRFAPRWIAMLGYVSALALLLGSDYLDWVLLVFPTWVLVVSGHFLSENVRKTAAREATAVRPPLLFVLVLLLLVTGCAGPSRVVAVPSDFTESATVLGLPNARFWADTQGPAMVQEAIAALARERAAGTGAEEPAQTLLPVSYLAVSGGSDNGAFGAGLLVGWSETGTRPTFKLVTGISTGALIAPFAFLGSAYDRQLRAVYTEIGPSDIYDQRWLPSAIFSDALTDTDPLFQLISRYANQQMLDDIGRAYRKGRLLLIGTTNLDVQRPVIWNIGAIAASGRPGALTLFRKILLASASVPALFPPVMIDVEVGGRHYQEMHVDGGAVAQTFLIPAQVSQSADLRGKQFARQRTAYVIRNARLDPEWASVDRRLMSITGRAINTMIHYSGYNDVVRIYFTSQRDGIGYNLAYIGDDFSFPHKRNFDTDYMRALFNYGYAEGRSGSAWHKAPPILAEPDGQEMLHPAGETMTRNP